MLAGFFKVVVAKKLGVVGLAEQLDDDREPFAGCRNDCCCCVAWWCCCTDGCECLSTLIDDIVDDCDPRKRNNRIFRRAGNHWICNNLSFRQVKYLDVDSRCLQSAKQKFSREKNHSQSNYWSIKNKNLPPVFLSTP